MWQEVQLAVEEILKSSISSFSHALCRENPETCDTSTLLRRRCRRFHGDGATLIRASRARRFPTGRYRLPVRRYELIGRRHPLPRIRAVERHEGP